MQNENVTDNVDGSYANPAQSVSFREQIMYMLGVDRWTIRCARVERYFNENPYEIKYFYDYYHLKITRDFKYLERHPNGIKYYFRIGRNIGAEKRGKYYYAFYILREGEIKRLDL